MEVIPSDATSVRTIQDIGAKIYPNPVGDRLHISVENGVSARVFDLSGRLAKQISITGLITVLPVSDLSSGEYIVEIQTTEGTGVFKLIKK